MLEQSRKELQDWAGSERDLAETIALRFLASELEQNLLPADEAARTAQSHKDARDETWQRTVYGIVLGLRAAGAQGHRLSA